MYPSCHLAPDACNEEVAKATVGGYYYFSGDPASSAPTGLYMYTRIEDMAVADGDSLEWADATCTEVTKDRAGGSSIGRRVCGVAVGTITDAYYGYILVQGVHNALKTDGGVSAGEYLVPHATSNGVADSMSDGVEEQCFAYCVVSDDSTNLVYAEVFCH